MEMTYGEALSAVKSLRDVIMLKEQSYKEHLIGAWEDKLSREIHPGTNKESIGKRLRALTEEAAKNVVERIHAFWNRTPYGDELKDNTYCMERGTAIVPSRLTQKLLDVGLIGRDALPRRTVVGKAELVERLYMVMWAEFDGKFTKKECKKALDELLWIMGQALEAGNDVQLTNFVKMSVETVEGRTGVAFGQEFATHRHNVVKFRASKKLNDKVNYEFD